MWFGQPVGKQKADAVHLLRQRVGVFSHLGDRICAEDAIDAQCQRSADAVALEKNHDVLHAALGLPRLHDPARAHFADAFDIENRAAALRIRLAAFRVPKAPTNRFAYVGPMPLIKPEPRYFSMPSRVAGSTLFQWST